MIDDFTSLISFSLNAGHNVMHVPRAFYQLIGGRVSSKVVMFFNRLSLGYANN